MNLGASKNKTQHSSAWTKILPEFLVISHDEVCDLPVPISQWLTQETLQEVLTALHETSQKQSQVQALAPQPLFKVLSPML